MTSAPPRLLAALADRYLIERELGQGGMATVYLAQDLKHERKVALKVLKPELAAMLGAERFVVEIRTTAALQHPHILPLFDSGTADGFLYYVMPFIDGETLRGKLDRETQLGVDEAVNITTDVADALQYAHEHGVIHRDIKPENILLANGRPMVADFGIALALSAAAGGRMTETGMSLGTPHYMSPEQATAEKELTPRSDIYSLGSVLYEMLTGNPPHTGASAQQIIMKIVTEDAAPVTKLRKSVPPNVAAAVDKAIEKVPADRFATAAEFGAALVNPGWVPTGGTVRMQGMAGTSSAGEGRWRQRALAGGALAALLLLAAVWGWLRPTNPGSVAPGELVRATLALGDSATIQSIANLRLAISPSGRRVVFVGADGPDQQLWIRDLDQPNARPLPDTKGAFDPFFSPDGESIGFFTTAGARAVLKVIPAAGGVARTVVSDSIAAFGGGDWGDDGNIYFTTDQRGLARVSATGGTVTPISFPDTANGIREHDFPDVLPGSRYAVVMLWMGSVGTNHIGVIDLATGVTTDVAPGSFARYVQPGFLAVGTSDNRVMVARFDRRKGRLTSTPTPLLQGVATDPNNGTLQFAVSETGTMLYQEVGRGGDVLLWVDRTGSAIPVDTTMTGQVSNVAISPDGMAIAVSRDESGAEGVWVKQLKTGTYSRLSTDVSSAARPTWTPDGRSVAIIGTREGHHIAWLRRADGSDNLRPAVPGTTPLDEIEFDRSGRYTVMRSEGAGVGSRRLLVIENGVDSAPRVLIQSRFDHYSPVLSPNGRWLAYVSDESGSPEVYVRPFPNVDSARIAISVGGGLEPMWRRDGAELFFRTTRGEMFAAPVKPGSSFDHGTPQLLFSRPAMKVDAYHHAYDVHSDGKRFVMVSSVGGLSTQQLNVVFNWRAELEKLPKQR